jgi:hypothetical protein
MSHEMVPEISCELLRIRRSHHDENPESHSESIFFNCHDFLWSIAQLTSPGVENDMNHTNRDGCSNFETPQKAIINDQRSISNFQSIQNLKSSWPAVILNALNITPGKSAM